MLVASWKRQIAAKREQDCLPMEWKLCWRSTFLLLGTILLLLLLYSYNYSHEFYLFILFHHHHLYIIIFIHYILFGMAN